jgi:hypothetical protein
VVSEIGGEVATSQCIVFINDLKLFIMRKSEANGASFMTWVLIYSTCLQKERREVVVTVDGTVATTN